MLYQLFELSMLRQLNETLKTFYRKAANAKLPSLIITYSFDEINQASRVRRKCGPLDKLGVADAMRGQQLDE